MRNLLRTTLLGSGVLALVGCMFNPTDDKVIESYETEVYFSGYLENPNDVATIQYWSFNTGEWVDVRYASTVSSTVPLTLSDGVAFYEWLLRTSLPASAWRPGPAGNYEARVRAQSQGIGNIFTLESDWGSCWATSVGSIAGLFDILAFLTSCSSDGVYELTLRTDIGPPATITVPELGQTASNGAS